MSIAHQIDYSSYAKEHFNEEKDYAANIDLFSDGVDTRFYMPTHLRVRNHMPRLKYSEKKPDTN